MHVLVVVSLLAKTFVTNMALFMPFQVILVIE